MKLIQCRVCLKENSDLALTCVYCGAQIKEKLSPDEEQRVNDVLLSIEMDRIRENDEEFLCCPKCYSNNLTPIKNGFSMGKAAAGFFTVGIYGIVAGSIGSGNIKLFCSGCGNKFNSGNAISLTRFQQKYFKKNLK